MDQEKIHGFFTGVHLHHHLLTAGPLLGHTGVTSASLTSLSFIAVEGVFSGLDCLADFPLDSCSRHSDKFELLKDLHAHTRAFQ